ncbi:MAG: hypothetical protein FJ301_12005 [Planctomycetes bacterium]|nr:hypothetical protein [Planctomycetota bacterium]
MSKWAVWAAHRYLRPGAAEPRTIGVDGRPLLRPWRQRSATACEAALRVRAARPRPWWPRLLGVALLVVAGIYALDPVGPLPVDVGPARRAGTDPRSAHLLASAPRGPVDAAAAARFAFAPQGATGPFTVVVLAADYSELLRRPGLDDTACTLDDTAGQAFVAGQKYHWYVLGERSGKPVASPVVSFEIYR